jgi:DNA-binding GntR family transcriptional regulator
VGATLPQRRRPSTAKVASLSDQVHEYLRSAIICGDLPPGAKLIELDIAAEMGTSQGPVREALQRLEHDGLVGRRARSATYVTNISIDEMHELFSIRSVIEGFAVRRTARTITPEQCHVLDDLIQQMAEAGTRQNIIPLAELDMRFHQHIVEWSESIGFLQAWTSLSGQLQRFIVQSHPERYPDFVEIGTRHQPIVEALRQRDVDAAEQALKEHIMLIWQEDPTP